MASDHHRLRPTLALPLAKAQLYSCRDFGFPSPSEWDWPFSAADSIKAPNFAHPMALVHPFLPTWVAGPCGEQEHL